MRIERILATTLFALLLSAQAQAQPLPPAASTDQTLDALHDRGQNLQSFTADITLLETDTTMGTNTTRTGTVVYQSKPNGDARLHVTFNTKSVNEKPPHPQRLEYLLDNGTLTKRDYETRLSTDYQVAKPGQKINLFQLGKGPFPLPIGQDRQAVHDSFDVKQIPADAKDPANTIHLQLTPKPNTDLAKKFSQIDVWVDRTQTMPVRIETQGTDTDANDRQTDLRNLKVNPQPPPTDADFSLPHVDESKWSFTTESLTQ